MIYPSTKRCAFTLNNVYLVTFPLLLLHYQGNLAHANSVGLHIITCELSKRSTPTYREIKPIQT